MQKNKTIILIGESNLFMEKVFKYNFKNADIKIIPDSYTPFDREDLAIKINSDYKQVIFFDYYNQFYLLLPLISKKIIKKYIINIGIPKFCEPHIFSNFQQVMEYKERGMIDYLGTTKYDLYEAFKKEMSYISLDYKHDAKCENNESIGILNDYYLVESNFYNELSAIALSKINKAIVLNQNIITKKFGEDFNVEIEEEKNIEKLIYKNIVNLDCKFCDISNLYFLMSMDAGIPCILGNTNLLDDFQELKNILVLESDDDVNEIKEKIEQAIEKKDKINSIYIKWRGKYSLQSKKTVDNFEKLGG